jgi:preprotein translocase subunit SecA
MDENWTEHLDVMGDLREGIGLRGYAQRDPLVEYKNEAFTLFEQFVSGIDSLVARRVLKIRRVNTPRSAEKLKTNEDQIEDILTGTREMTGKIDELVSQGKKQQQRVETLAKSQGTVKGQVKVGRNDPCPCGSGQKYKKCGLINSAEHQKRMQSTS